ncbi:PAS domain S-box protein [uncultured Desulfobacter sp.]|uniref:PAS domain-containing sensor histidine kinase n=1 Tax=uncultured Desulfobacter sp. TaxID=240139 RepID=UPI002AABFCA1|nr:PAS domain S-box protein [uncultured Desulfobacter sp.]
MFLKSLIKSLRGATAKNQKISSEREFYSAFNAMKSAVWIIDKDHRILKSNNAAQRLFNQTHSEIIGKKCWEIVHGTDLPVKECPLLKASQSLQQESMELKINDRWLEVVVDPILDSRGKLLKYVHITTDMTKNKLTSEKLERSRKLLDSAQHLAKTGGWEWNVEQQKMYWTKELYRLHGFEPSQFESGSVDHIKASLECYNVEDQHKALDAFHKCEKQGIPYELEFEFRRASGEKIWIRTAAEPVWKGDKIEKVIGNVIEITEFKLAKDTLFVQSERIKTLFNSISDAVFVHPLKLDGFAPFVEVNDIACKRYGYTYDELMNLSAPDITVKPDVNEHSKQNNREKLLEEGQLVFETFHIKNSGETFPVEINSNIFYQNEKPHILAVVRDITDRKITEKALRKSEQEFRNLFENHAAVKLIIDPHTGQIVAANRAAEDFYGWSRLTLTQMNINQINTKSIDEIKQLMENAKDQKRILFDFQHRLADGSIRDVEVFSSGVEMNGHNYLHSIIHDITEQKKAKTDMEELRIQNWHLKKKESLSRMASAIAHHFNNHLMAIMGNLELSLSLIERNESPLEHLKKSMQLAQKAAEVSGLMLTYLGKTTSGKMQMDISKVCSMIIPILRSSLPKHIVLKSNFPVQGPMVNGDLNQIQQLVTNLVANAAESYQEKGTVYISLKTVLATEIPQKYRFPVNWSPSHNEYACLEIADAGCGIEEQNIEKIFDPFFSTKATGRGLDLAVVLGIVQANNGVITVKSQWGEGSIFRFFSPVETKLNE